MTQTQSYNQAVSEALDLFTNILKGARPIKRGFMKGYVDLGPIKAWELDHALAAIAKAKGGAA